MMNRTTELRKKCSKCGIDLPLSKFCVKTGAKHGRNSQCRECVKQYRIKNREHIIEYRRKHYADNAEQYAEYRLKNKEFIAKRSKKYYADNKEYFAEYKQTYKEYYAEYNKKYSVENKEYLAEYSK